MSARILVVEDEKGIADFIKQGLEEEGFSVDVAVDGERGLALSLSGMYDLLLLDWMLPSLSGIELCRRFREEFRDVPVIFLTARDTVGETVMGFRAGANDYVKKPFHFDELLERVRVQLRGRSGGHEVISLGRIEMDISAHRVFNDGEEARLTRKEFSLLEYLIRNKGKVCRRDKIIESVWDIHFDYDTGVIDVYINSLRKKLGLDEGSGYIQTVRGVGYIAREDVG